MTPPATSPGAPPAVPPARAAREDAKFRVLDLRAWFGKQEVLHGIHLDIARHEVTAVIGPSGCGKSTFIRCLNRMHEMTLIASMEGKVLLDGEDIYGPDVDPVVLRRRVAWYSKKPIRSRPCRSGKTSWPVYA